MAENSWPFYGTETTETQFSKWARTLAENGINSGLTVTASSTSDMKINLASGSAIVRGLYYENDSTKSLTVGTAPTTAGQTRLDALILRLDMDANTITAVIKAGSTNSSGGSLPSLTQNETTFEMLIAIITVAAGVATTTSGMIVQLRPSIGERVLVANDDRMPAASSASGGFFFNTTTKQLLYSDGTSWDNLHDVSHLTGTLGVGNGGTGVTTLKALRQALDIYVQPTQPAHKAGRVWIPATSLA